MVFRQILRVETRPDELHRNSVVQRYEFCEELERFEMVLVRTGDRDTLGEVCSVHDSVDDGANVEGGVGAEQGGQGGEEVV